MTYTHLEIERSGHVVTCALSNPPRHTLNAVGVLELAIDPELSAAQRPLLVHQGRLLDSLGAETWGHVVRMMSLLQAAIRDAREAGDVPETVDPVLDAEAIFHLSLGWMSGRVIGRVVPTWEEAERVVAFALRGLGGRGPEA